jgi:hypothetical protein
MLMPYLNELLPSTEGIVKSWYWLIMIDCNRYRMDYYRWESILITVLVDSEHYPSLCLTTDHNRHVVWLTTYTVSHSRFSISNQTSHQFHHPTVYVSLCYVALCCIMLHYVLHGQSFFFSFLACTSQKTQFLSNSVVSIVIGLWRQSNHGKKWCDLLLVHWHQVKQLGKNGGGEGGGENRSWRVEWGIDFKSFRRGTKSLVVTGTRFEPETFLIPSSDRLVVLWFPTNCSRQIVHCRDWSHGTLHARALGIATINVELRGVCIFVWVGCGCWHMRFTWPCGLSVGSSAVICALGFGKYM